MDGMTICASCGKLLDNTSRCFSQVFLMLAGLILEPCGCVIFPAIIPLLFNSRSYGSVCIFPEQLLRPIRFTNNWIVYTVGAFKTTF